MKYENIIFTLEKGNIYNFLVDENGNDLEEYGLSIELMIDPECKFEILSNEEEEKEIDIDNIEEIIFLTNATDNDIDIGNKVNDLIKAVKQLNKKIN